MADSIRKSIYDAVVTALSASTGILHVTRNLEPWWDWPSNKFPGVCVVDGDESKQRFSYLQSTGGDMYSELEFRILGYERDMNNDLTSKRSTLLQTVETVLQNSSAINDLTLDIIPISVKTDKGEIENFTVTESVFKVKYLYNHASP